MESKILALLGQADYQPSNVPALLAALQLKSGQQQELQAVLAKLVQRGLILRLKGNRYALIDDSDLITGTIQITRGGKGFVQPDEAGVPEIAIAERHTAPALNGDRVQVRRAAKTDGPRGAAENTGTVVRVIERKRSHFVGTLQITRNQLHVLPDDPRLPNAIYVPEPRDVGRRAQLGDKVVVEITAWESDQIAPDGQIIEVLGPPDAEGVDMLSVLRNYDLPLHFPKNVLAAANGIAKSRPDNQPSEEECAGRTDCRSHSVVTIDPDDAKDFDDAICILREGSDEWRLWVHIADVSHYVQPASVLDVEARKRGNSTYLVDRVIPMLPEALSNELCSLKPDIDRLTKCAEFVLSDDGEVRSTKFYSAIIRSKKRYTYKQAFAVIQSTPKTDLERMLHDAHRVAQSIRRRRFANGSLDLDFPENKIRLDEKGAVLRIERIENDVSHQLIEEYMLLANEAVAARLMKLAKPSVYRVHESPKEKRLNDFRADVLSHQVPCGNLTHRPEVQRLLARFNSLPIGPALKIGFLRSLMRARYAVEPLGHYGLAKTQYTHFTSPIRRYADLVVHRSLFGNVPLSASAAKQIAEHITGTEKNSSDAERDSKEVKLYAYLRAQLDSDNPQPYTALVTDIRHFGFFVDVPDLGLNGLVPLSAIADDYYIFDAQRSQLVGRQTRKIIQLGNNVTVHIAKVDSVQKQVEFKVVPEVQRKTKERTEHHQPRVVRTPQPSFYEQKFGKRKGEAAEEKRRAEPEKKRDGKRPERPFKAKETPPVSAKKKPNGKPQAPAPKAEPNKPSGAKPMQRKGVSKDRRPRGPQK